MAKERPSTELLTTRQLATKLHVTTQTIWRMKLTPAIQHKRIVRYDFQDVLDQLAKRQAQEKQQ